MKYTDEQHIEKIISYTDKLLDYLKEKDITREVIDKDETVRWAVTTPLYNIGEHSYNLSSEYRGAHSEVPWAKISGLRHRLVHDYEDTNWNIISDIIFNVLPEFQKQLQEIKNGTTEEK